MFQYFNYDIIIEMKRGPKPKGKVNIKWGKNFAYAIGLLVADGCLSKDGRHIDLTSKDKIQVKTFKECLKLDTKIGKKFSGGGNLSYHTQFGDVLFYRFLMSIGIFPAKSKTILSVSVPKRYFFDFLRGYFDGDGSSYSYYDPKYKNSFRFYISFTSGSRQYIDWLRKKIYELIDVKGFLSYNRNNPYVQLKYAKKEAIIISKNMYYCSGLSYLKRKFKKITQSLNIIESSRSGEIGKHAVFRTQ